MLIDRYPAEDVFARVPEVADQTDPVLVQLDRLLDDDDLYAQVRADLVRRHRLTAVHGRHSTPAEAILRLLVVKHLYAWSYQETMERVADSLVLRWFCRVYFRRVPDATTLLRWAHTITPPTLHLLNDRAAQLAAQARVTRARKLRVDGTVVETTIHHPTDSGLLGDGVRVLTRLDPRVRGRSWEPSWLARATPSVTALAPYAAHSRPCIGWCGKRARRSKPSSASCMRTFSRRPSRLSSKRGRPSRHSWPACNTGERPRGSRRESERLQKAVERFLPLVAQVIRQTRMRVLEGNKVPAQDKIVSLFEPHTRILQRRKTGVPSEFGRHVVLDEVEGGIVTRYRILPAGGGEQGELEEAVAHHRAVFGHPPELVAADRAFHAPEPRSQASSDWSEAHGDSLERSDDGRAPDAGTQPGVEAALPLSSRHRGAHPQPAPGLRPQTLCRPRGGGHGTPRGLGYPGE